MASNRHAIQWLSEFATKLSNEIDSLNDQLDAMERENWALKQALGYPIPADKDTPNNPFRCGICDARNK